MTDKELMQRAFIELKDLRDGFNPESTHADEVLDALRARLAQPEPEPIAWFVYIPSQQCGEYFDSEDDDGLVDWMTNYPDAELTKLYTAPPQREWVGLTDEEITETLKAFGLGERAALARAIETKLKEKNT